MSKCHVKQSGINLIGAIIGVDEKRAPLGGQGRAVNAVTVVLCCNEGLARHHVQHRLVLTSGKPRAFLIISLQQVTF